MRYFLIRNIFLKIANRVLSGIILALSVFFGLAYFSGSASAASVVLNPASQNCIASNRTADLSWSSDMGGNPAYHILRKIQGTADYAEIGNIHSTSYADTDNAAPLLSGKIYSYKIKAEQGVDIVYSNEIIAGEYYCSPVIFENVPACKASGPYNNISWTGATGDLRRYEIWRGGTKIGETDKLIYSDEFNISGTSAYDYFIKTFWADGTSRDSDIVSITALACPPILSVNSGCKDNISPGGPMFNLSWNNLLGATKYDIYRKAPGETGDSVIAKIDPAASLSYTDELVSSLPLSYWQSGNAAYKIKAFFGDSVSVDSEIVQVGIPRCNPFLSTAGMCDPSGNPEIRLGWTRTMDSVSYNIYRDNGPILIQLNGSTVFYSDSFDPSNCSTGGTAGICTHDYTVKSSIANFPGYFVSNTAAQNIDCATIIPPSPAPVLNDPKPFCEAGKSKIELNWTPSANAEYYTIYRNNSPLINIPDTSYIDSGVGSGVDYSYYIVAFGRGGLSTPISDVNVKIVSAFSCTAPENSVLTLSKLPCSLGVPQIALSWTSTGNTVEYEIKKGLSEANMETKAIIANSGTVSLTDTDSNLAPNTPYYYQVFSRGVLGVPPSPSNLNFITSDKCFPATPAVTLTPDCLAGAARIKVSWTSNNSNTQRYEIYKYNGVSSEFVEKVDVIPGTTSYNRTYNVSPSALYKYKVEAVGYQPGQRSTQGYKSATSYSCSAPGAFALSDPPATVCQASYPFVNLNWTSSDNATSYDVIRNNLNSSETSTFFNKTSPYADSGFGNSLRFDGGSYVDLGLTNMPLTGDLTIEFWANPSDMAYAKQNPICKAFGGEFCLTMETDGDLYYFHGSSGKNAPPHISFGTPDVFENNKWVHVIITRNTAARTMKSYKNGNFASSVAWPSNYNPVKSINSLFIGKGNAANFEGMIDEVRIYSRVLSANEALEHYKGVYNNENDLIGLWHMDEGAGQIISDSSNFDNNGMLGASSGPESSDPVWVKNGLDFQSQYTWNIKASGLGGDVFSNMTAPIKLPLCSPVKAGFKASPICDGGTKGAVSLSWSYSFNADKFEIYRGGELIKTILSTDSEFDSRVWVDNNNGDGLTQEKSYSYYIKSIGLTGLSTQSDTQTSVVPLCLLPAVPQNVIAEFGCPVPGVSGNIPQIKISWNAVDNVSYYKVYRNNLAYGALLASPDNFYPLPSTTDIFYYDNYPSVGVNKEYKYIIRSNNSAGESDASIPVTILAGNYCTPSVPAINPIATSCQSDAPVNTISWSDATLYNTEKYEIYRKLAAETNFSLLASVNKGTPAFTSRVWNDTAGLNPAAVNSASYRIKSIGPSGLSSVFSGIQNKDTYACAVIPETPSGLTLSGYCSENKPYANIFWNNSANAYSYNLERNNITDSIAKTYSTVLPSKNDVGSRALKFDGVNDYVNIFSTISNPNSVTIEAWVKPDVFIDGNSTIYLAGSQSSTQGYSWLYFTSSRIYYQFSTGTGTASSYAYTSLALNEWNHLVVTHDYAKKEVKFYKNGVSVASYPANYTVNAVPVANKPVKIGAYSASQNRFHGTIDEVRAYDRPLSPAEVGEHYNNIYRNETSLQGVWHFDERNNIIVYDSSGNGRNGKIAGPEWSDGKDDGALQFGGMDGYAELPSFNLSQSLTVEAWVYSENIYADDARIIDFGNGGSSDNIILGFYGTSGKMFLQTYQGSVSGGSIITASVFPQNQWVHVVAVINGYGDGSIYWDGVSKKTGTVGIPSSLARSNQYIGKSNFSGDAYFNGKIDEFRIYRRALSASEIDSHKDGNFSDDPSLAILLHLDEKSGVTAADSSGKSGSGNLKIGAERVDSDFPGYVLPLESGKTYNFSVKAAGINTLSGSAEASLSVPSCLPSVPVLTIDPNTCNGSNTQVKLSWPSDTNVSYWSIYKNSVWLANTTSNLFTDLDVASGSTYAYYIKANGYKSDIYEYSNSESIIVSTCFDMPATPIMDIPEKRCDGSASKIIIKWTPYDNKTLSFDIYRINTTNGESFTDSMPPIKNMPNLGPSALQFKDGNVVATEKYKYKVKAIGSSASNSSLSASSDEVEAKDCLNAIPNPPEGLSINTSATFIAGTGLGTGGSVSIKWKDSDAETSYKVLRRISAPAALVPQNSNFFRRWLDKLSNMINKVFAASSLDPSADLIATLVAGTQYVGNEYIDTPPDGYIYYYDYNVSENTTYEYQILAVKGVNEIASSAPSSILVSVPKAFPGQFNASYTPISLNKIKLEWTEAATTAISGPITYKIIKSSIGNDFSTSDTVCEIADTDPSNPLNRVCVDSNFSSAKKYYRIAATNGGGSRLLDLGVLTLSNWKEVIPQ